MVPIVCIRRNRHYVRMPIMYNVCPSYVGDPGLDVAILTRSLLKRGTMPDSTIYEVEISTQQGGQMDTRQKYEKIRW